MKQESLQRLISLCLSNTFFVILVTFLYLLLKVESAGLICVCVVQQHNTLSHEKCDRVHVDVLKAFEILYQHHYQAKLVTAICFRIGIADTWN